MEARALTACGMKCIGLTLIIPAISRPVIAIEFRPRSATLIGGTMKSIATAAIVTLALTSLLNAATESNDSDPCQSKNSNAEQRECYAKGQVRVSAKADSLAGKVAAQLRREAQDKENAREVARLLRGAASAITGSQKSWKAYRNQYCKAVEDSYGPGTGGGTGYERCMFQLGKDRLRELQSGFSYKYK